MKYDHDLNLYLIYENEDWIRPLQNELEAADLPYVNWNLAEEVLSLTAEPPKGIFYNRMSASAHTRGNSDAVVQTQSVIDWLESHGRRVINGHNTLRIELSKALQNELFKKHGLCTPQTNVCESLESLFEQAIQFPAPFIIKPNRGGKGFGVRLFDSLDSLKTKAESEIIQSPDGILILQEYLKPRDGNITRMEFIGGKFCYAVLVDASSGFELCPADSCNVRDDQKFEIIENFVNPDIPIIENMLRKEKIDVAGIEFLTDQSGNHFYYDINTTTNYNADAESRAGHHWNAMKQVVKLLKEVFDRESPKTATL